MTNVSKNNKKKFLRCVLTRCSEFLRILYPLESISSEIVWIDKLHHEGIYFPDNDRQGNKKANFSVIIGTVATSKKNWLD